MSGQGSFMVPPPGKKWLICGGCKSDRFILEPVVKLSQDLTTKEVGFIGIGQSFVCERCHKPIGPEDVNGQEKKSKIVTPGS